MMTTRWMRKAAFLLTLAPLAAACASEPALGDDDDDAGEAKAPPPTSGPGGGAADPPGGTAQGGGAGTPSCDVFSAGGCGDCLEAKCCEAVAACASAPGCLECVTGQGELGCEGSVELSLFDCASTSCNAECYGSGQGGAGGTGGAGGGSGGSGAGGNGGVDTVSCTGPASSNGTVLGVTPVVTVGEVAPDPSGNVIVALLPSTTISAGDVIVAVYFFAQVGQLDYPPNGTVGCAILESAGGSWNVIDTTQLCEVHLTALSPASASGTCDGFMQGTFMGVFSGNQPLSGSFTLPSDLAASELTGPSCQPANGPCSQNSDCCSSSCSMYIGVCN